MAHTDIQAGSKPVMSINQFCQSHEISRQFFNKLNKSGGGPAIIKIGRRVLISTEAAAEWRARHTVGGNNQLEMVAK